jgi:uncharacterized protein
MQLSQFNHFADRPDGTVLFFNAFTGSMGTMQRNTFLAITAEQLKADLLEPSTKRDLVEWGVLTNIDELKKIQTDFDADKSATTSSISFTIAPTIACNFDCSYCYQDHSNKKVMSENVQNQLRDFLTQLAQAGLKRLSVTWFGGEPLIAHKVISRLSPLLHEDCDRYGVSFQGASIITNGTLLTRERAIELRRLGIKKVQISFDSLIYKIPAKRGIRMEDGSPSPILLNCLINRDILDFSIRINVGRELDPDLPELLEQLERYGLSESVYVSRIHNEKSGIGWAATPTDHTISVIKFVSRKNELVTIDEPSINERLASLNKRNHFCGATRLTSFAFDAFGNAYRCWHSVGNPKEAVFSLDEMTKRYKDDSWSKYTPLNYSECRSCKVLPLCMGGCSHGRVAGLNDKPPCEPIKFEIEPLMKFLAKKVNLSDLSVSQT